MAEQARAILGAGLVTLALWDAVLQAWSEFDAPVDADKFEIKPNFEEKTSTSKSHLDYGQARASVILPAPTEITIEIAAANARAFAMQFQGAVAALSQAADASVQTLDITAAVAGKEYALPKANITETSFDVAKTGTPATKYAAGSDFTINWKRGTIRILPGGACVGQNVTVSYKAAAIDGAVITGGSNPQIRCKARFDGINMADGSALLVDVDEAVLGASNAFDFLASDFVAIQLTGKLVGSYRVKLPDTALA